ncbi:MAG: VWA domain-containing protein [bacterium]|nr:VWA domain-containing protein [bacterium]
MPIFIWPIALFALTALPGVAAIYMLRTRSRKHVVSSLMLWNDQRRAQTGGLKFQRIQTPLLLILELLIVTLLVLAAAGLKIPTDNNRRPLVIVLDDSLSMQAGGKNSPQTLARKTIQNELDTGRHHPVQFIIASEQPRTMDRTARTTQLAMKALDAWTCMSATSDLQSAVVLAEALSNSNSGARKGRILVITDHKPAKDPGPGDTRWIALGKPRENIAFTTAVRSEQNSQQQCLLEITNFSDAEKSTTLTIHGIDQPQQRKVVLASGSTNAIRLNVPNAQTVVRATLSDDNLPIDNAITLLPQPQRIIHANISIADNSLRNALTKAMTASRRVKITNQKPTLLISDRSPTPAARADAWTVQFLIEGDANAYVGPFVVDRSCPLSDGLSLKGTIWGAGKTTALPGRTVVAAGNVPLITDRKRLGGRREIRIRLCPEISTLQNSSNWPVLISNLLEYHATVLPGMERTNIRLGLRGRVALPNAEKTITVTEPDGKKRTSPVTDRSAFITARKPGVYTVKAKAVKYQFSVNALSPAESDLRTCVTDEWGDWKSDSAIAVEYRSLSWLLLLLALGMIAAHAAIISGGSKGWKPWS